MHDHSIPHLPTERWRSCSTSVLRYFHKSIFTADKNHCKYIFMFVVSLDWGGEIAVSNGETIQAAVAVTHLIGRWRSRLTHLPFTSMSLMLRPCKGWIAPFALRLRNRLQSRSFFSDLIVHTRTRCTNMSKKCVSVRICRESACIFGPWI